jgi:hypothetical protein
VFLINVPIGIAAFAGAVRVLPRTVAHPGIRLDAVGMVLVGLALTAIIYPLIQGRTDGWAVWTFVMLGTGAALLAAFALWERRYRGDPLIEPGLLANHTYTSGILVALAFFGAFGGLLLCILIGLGAGASMGQLFDFILAGVGMDEIGSASGVLEAVQQLSSAIGVAALGTIFFSAFAGHLPTHALAITAWACLALVALAFALIFRLPMHAREPVAS